MFFTFEKIKELADKQGISLNQLEEQLDFPRNTIYNMKKSTPNVERVSKIADYFNVSTDYLLGRTENPKIADGQDNTAVDDLTQQAIVLFRKETEGLSASEKERFNSALEGLMKTAKQLIQDDSNWK